MISRPQYSLVGLYLIRGSHGNDGDDNDYDDADDNDDDDDADDDDSDNDDDNNKVMVERLGVRWKKKVNVMEKGVIMCT